MDAIEKDVRRTAGALRALVDATSVSADDVTGAVEALRSGHPMVRRAALDALGALAEHRRIVLPLGVAAVARALTTDADPEVRAEAVSSLALLPLEDGLDGIGRAEALVERLADPDAPVRQGAAAALGDLSGMGVDVEGPARAALAAHLVDPDPGVVFEAAFALATLGDKRARPVLETSTRDRRRRLDAIEGLARLGDAEAVPLLQQLERKWLLPWVDRLAALGALTRLGDAEGRARLIARIGTGRREEQIHALALLGQLGVIEARAAVRAAAAVGDEPTREAAFEALCRIGDEADLAWLEAEAGARTSSADLRASAAEAARGLRSRMDRARTPK